MDTLTANLIQAAVLVERGRCISIVLREALWPSAAAKGQPITEEVNPVQLRAGRP